MRENALYREDLKTAMTLVKGLDRLRGCSLLITGATGLIGSFLVDLLLYYNECDGAQIRIYACGRSRERLADRFGEESEQLVFVEHDVTKMPEFDFSVDYIIHAASNAYPAVFQKDPVGTIMSNVLGTKYLLDYGRCAGMKRFCYVSSGEVYGQGHIEEPTFREEYCGYMDLSNARSCYPAGKRTAEVLCVSYMAQYGTDTVIVRPSHTFGPNVTGTDNRATVQFINNALAGQDIVMKSAGTQMRSYTYIADAAAALLTVLLKGESGTAYNIANPASTVTIAGFARLAAAQTGVKVVFENPSQLEKGQQSPVERQVLDPNRLLSLGWEPVYDIEKGIARTIAVCRAER